ncbi:SDR family oxidoreductase (plasmid) [Bartonella sp. HY329]|uniref:SDR family oxidoreductase n=1 Tax=unclassified Bartonella TaxID=2645622 RepID=UPI0021C5D878|nr:MULTISPECIES: SDR family oxidoreductase [unclassified Bartonella]UXM96605.1 SDR family oxidoreductase [Bartonella sp. HY329]UXN10928.1 SDR family oxidoreductase [Bartonella sp. HY328]
MNKILQGKIAAITGAASGIGLASTRAMMNAGAKVVLIDRDKNALDKVCQELGSMAVPLVLDLLNRDECKNILSRLLEVVDHIDIFHANAGIYIGGDLINADLDHIDRMLELNINVVMKNVRSIMPHMMERKTGDIIVTSSLAAHAAVVWEPVYASSKWAVDCFVQTMRRQLRSFGIRVGSVSPGPVISALLADWPEENLEKAKKEGSLMEPSEVADAIVFMLSRPRNVTIRDMVIIPSNFDL